MAGANETVTLLRSTWQFAINEFERINAMLDKAHVAGEVDGVVLTASERVGLLTALPRFYLDDEQKESARATGILEEGDEPRTH